MDDPIISFGFVKQDNSYIWPNTDITMGVQNNYTV